MLILPHRPAKRRRSATTLLETLEIRALLSAALQVSGNGTVIAFNDNKPATVDFTDFRGMSTTADTTDIGTVSRTYTLTNTGDADLHITGVTISGTGAGDFHLEAPVTGTITSGTANTLTFTVDFIPTASGTRSAKITINSDDPSHPAFTFAIQGTGLATVNDTSNHLETATTHAGKGAAAASGTEIVVDYTGYLLDGTVFDQSTFESNAIRGHNPLAFQVGAGQVIPGFDQGVLNIKVGETRTIVIPGALAYTDAENPPAAPLQLDETLIFVVTRRAAPAVTVGGLINGQLVPIAFGENIPSASDGSFMGTIPANSTTSQAAFIYHIDDMVDPGQVLRLTKTQLTFTGPNASAFKSGVISGDTVNGGAFVSVLFAPRAAGTDTAVAHLHTNDPVHPDFQFTIAATFTPFVDLTDSLGHINYPASGTITSGSPTTYTVPFTVTNHGNSAVPANAPATNFQIFLQEGSGEPTQIATIPSTALRNLGAGKSKVVNVSFSVPITIPAATYHVIADVNANNVIVESNAANNSAGSAQNVTVIQGTSSLSGGLTASTFPASIAHDASTLAGKLSFTLAYAGNVNLPVGEKLNIQLVAVDGSADETVLGTTSISVSGWVPGKGGTFTVNGSLPGTLAAGAYHLAVRVTPSPDLTAIPSFLVDSTAAPANINLTVT